MKIKRLRLHNYRGIENAELDLRPNFNLFVGINGSGKSTILDAVATSLSWLINRIQREGSSGRPITTPNIKNNQDLAAIYIDVEYRGKNYDWSIVKTQRGSRNAERSLLENASSLANEIAQVHNEHDYLPVIVYYPINRLVNQISPDLAARDSVTIFDVYENAVDGRTNFQNFFEWFRIQDDIVNETANSRSKWMVKNASWIRKRADKLMRQFDLVVQSINREDIDYRKEIHGRMGRDIIHGEPRFMFHEISEIIHFVQYSNRDNDEFNEIFHELDYMLHKMSALSDNRRDDLVELNDYPLQIIWQIISQIFKIQERSPDKTKQMKLVNFTWDALALAVLLSLWWMSDRGKRKIELLFSNFLVDLQSHKGKNTDKAGEFMIEIEKSIKNDIDHISNAVRNHGRELYFVTKCIENFLPGYSNLRMTRLPRPQMLIDKSKETVGLDQLSDGEKNLIAMVGDIARRLAIANPRSDNPLEGEGIVLIDEVDLHLHPSWQRLMVPRMSQLFPNCQFLITTHSPQVISHTFPDNVFLLKWDNYNNFNYEIAHESYGRNTDRILEDLLDVDARPLKVKNDIEKIYTAIDQNNLEKAKKLLHKLSNTIGDDPELARVRAIIKRKEIIKK